MSQGSPDRSSAGAPTARPEAVSAARASLGRCQGAADLFPSFYQTFFARCPAAAPRFANTDFARQNKLLQHAIGLLLAFPGSRDPSLLMRVAERHNRRGLDIPPEMYAPFVDALVETIGRYDPAFTPDLEAAWREAIAPGVAFMQSRY